MRPAYRLDAGKKRGGPTPGAASDRISRWELLRGHSSHAEVLPGSRTTTALQALDPYDLDRIARKRTRRRQRADGERELQVPGRLAAVQIEVELHRLDDPTVAEIDLVGVPRLGRQDPTHVVVDHPSELQLE